MAESQIVENSYLCAGRYAGENRQASQARGTVHRDRAPSTCVISPTENPAVMRAACRLEDASDVLSTALKLTASWLDAAMIVAGTEYTAALERRADVSCRSLTQLQEPPF